MKIATRFRKSLCLGTAAFAAIGLFAAVSEVSASVIDYQALIQGNSALVHHYTLDGASDAVRLEDKEGSADLAVTTVANGGVISVLPTLGAAGFDATSSSADFDGATDDRLATGATAVTLDGTSFTSEAIVRMDVDANQYVFTANEGGGGDRTLMLVQDFFGDATAAVGGGTFGPGAEYIAEAALSAGDWYFLAATFTVNGAGVDMQTYAANLTTGGALVAGTATNEPLGTYNTSATSLFLGGPWFDGTNFKFGGAIDEAAIFDGALSASTIAAHHAAIGIPEPTSVMLLAVGMVSLYGMRLRKKQRSQR